MDRRNFIRLAAATALSPIPAVSQARDAAKSPLEIARVDPFVIRIGSRENIVVCRVETTDGLHGWGEGTSPPNIGPVVAQIRSLGKVIKGQRAWDTERIWRRMYTVE